MKTMAEVVQIKAPIGDPYVWEVRLIRTRRAVVRYTHQEDAQGLCDRINIDFNLCL
jgi:hypothetical protein